MFYIVWKKSIWLYNLIKSIRNVVSFYFFLLFSTRIRLEIRMYALKMCAMDAEVNFKRNYRWWSTNSTQNTNIIHYDLEYFYRFWQKFRLLQNLQQTSLFVNNNILLRCKTQICLFYVKMCFKIKWIWLLLEYV